MLHLPDTDQEGNPRIVDGNGDGTLEVDMGAYEYRINPCPWMMLPGDTDADGLEIALFAREFGRNDCSKSLPCPGDLNDDGQVDKTDLDIFAQGFGQETCP